MTVSVCMITYNHEAYIIRAIDSVLMQQTNFMVRLIIGEDNSRDKTLSICEEYQKRFPDKIQIITTGANVGMMQNFIRTHKACDGKYIAFIEGDDYWTDPMKLQKQIDFLESNPGYSVCFHNVLIEWINAQRTSDWAFQHKISKETFETKDLLGPWFIPTASVVVRNHSDFTIPDWFQFCKSGDIPYMLLMSLKGKLKFLPEMMSVYRVHDKGISATHNGYDKIIAMIYIYENFNIHTGFKYRDKVKEAMIYEIQYHLPVSDDVKEEGSVMNNTSIVAKMYRKFRDALLHYGA